MTYDMFQELEEISGPRFAQDVADYYAAMIATEEGFITALLSEGPDQ